MRFKLGQEVTLRENRELQVIFGNFADRNFPKFGEIYTVSGYPMQGHPHYQNWLSLEELPPKNVFNDDIFEPVVSGEQLENDLEEIELMCQKYKHGLIDG